MPPYEKKASQKKVTRAAKVPTPVVSSESEGEEDALEVKLEKTMKKLFNDFKKEMKKDMRDFEVSLEFNNNKLDDLIKKMGNMQNTINAMAEKQEKLEIENRSLRMKVNQMEISVDEMDQYSRIKNIQIDGVPVTRDEDLKEVVKTMGQKIEVNIKSEDIDAIHRIPSRSNANPEPIVVQFVTRQMKENVVKKSKEKRVCTDDLNMQCANKPVFVNEHLTRKRKNIMFEARKLKNEKNYKFLWSRNGKILIKKNETSITIQLNSLDDLAKII
uniref:FP protein C-terminal domain-containing protein n=1 Tax=Cacopsylla melanoneura TaxID=428564 RepID=A0A8D8SSS6_9HEMI